MAPSSSRRSARPAVPAFAAPCGPVIVTRVASAIVIAQERTAGGAGPMVVLHDEDVPALINDIKAVLRGSRE